MARRICNCNIRYMKSLPEVISIIRKRTYCPFPPSFVRCSCKLHVFSMQPRIVCDEMLAWPARPLEHLSVSYVMKAIFRHYVTRLYEVMYFA